MFADAQHVQYILLAEFDIDKGASLNHQYPSETGTNEQILSELMLPDGAHMRSEDWTVFFLNQTIEETEKSNQRKLDDDVEEKPLLYVLNLVRTKHDINARRGATVRAMAICTRHQYLHIYKPVLLLAMENYFSAPSIAILESLYKAVNSMDLSQMPHFTFHERQILRAAESKNMFEEKFEAMEAQQSNGATDSASLAKLADMGISAAYNGSNMQLATSNGNNIANDRMRRGTYIDLTSGQRREVLPTISKDRHFFETKVIYDGIKLPIRVPLTLNTEEVGDFSLIQLISTFSPPTITSSTHAYHPHLDSNGATTHPIIILLNALITQKRIIFLGHGHPSGEVANYVLAACAMGSGCGTTLRGFTERAFPYANLTSVDDLSKCPGFIAGVTNPTFEDHPSWWDVMCNISTGKITVSKEIQPANSSSSTFPDAIEDIAMGSLSIGRSSTTSLAMSRNFGYEMSDTNSDNEFMSEVLAAIQAHYGEASIRAKFEDYMQRFVRLAALYEEETYHSTKIGTMGSKIPDPLGIHGQSLVFTDETARQRELAYNTNRIEGWRQTISYRYYQRDFATLGSKSVIKNMDVYRHISRLKMLKHLPEEQVIALFKLFLDVIKTDDQITELLSYLPQNQGGLLPLGFGLFHPSAQVRNYTVEFFNRLDHHPVGRKFIQSLNRFQKLAYERLNQTSPSNEQSNRPNTLMDRQNSFGRSPTPTDHLVVG
ncbi:hypothetical protein K450DRAFT_182945 [Umbelopsis ramanniana AG]|uniref:UDENN domain-containing protein n=1 Tax=Umbelopsis ramanniana AG TaxID=1314678 RepID=A0AAD5HID2_UMBRA|nr:uncharacterized protein K450DRAFT_182945 [Umbelopsis ramanniana AG]KAI8583546.1 hypothetical protein K450DRAFT_182945 [Umbelopsis ramanniana AG]